LSRGENKNIAAESEKASFVSCVNWEEMIECVHD